MQIGQRRIVEPAREKDLTRRRGEQIGAAHHVRDLLRCVVDNDGELIGVEAVGAPDDEIADIAREILRYRSLQAVAEFYARGVDAHASCPLRTSAPIRGQPVATGSGI